MSDWIVEAQVVSVSLSSDDWVKVIWRTRIEGKEVMISSNFGPDFGLREKFYDRTGVGPKNLSTLEGKVFGVRVYKSSKGKLQVSPADLFVPNKQSDKPAEKPATLTQPLAAMAKVVTPPPNAPREEFKKTVVAAKATPVEPNPIQALAEEIKETKALAEEAKDLVEDVGESVVGVDAKTYKSIDPHVKRFDTKAVTEVEADADKLLASLQKLNAKDGIAGRVFMPELLEAVDKVKAIRALAREELGLRKLNTK